MKIWMRLAMAHLKPLCRSLLTVPYFVYIVKCMDGSLYTGITTNLDRRIAEHNSGKGAKYTRFRAPVHLVYSERQEDRADASRRELEIKSLSRQDKLKMIEHYKLRPTEDGYEHIVHPLKPFYTPESKVLVLGSFPSIKTRESKFFYGHPQNRFWPLMSRIVNHSTVPTSIQEKQAFLKNYDIACYDVIYECDIIGSQDSSVKNVVPSNVLSIVNDSNITLVVTNGGLATKLYKKYQTKKLDCKHLAMPSTSPANARYSLEMLEEKWLAIKPYLL